MPATRKAKVHCPKLRGGCGWSGERADFGPYGGPFGAVTDKPCPRCGRRSVERVGRTNPNRQEA